MAQATDERKENKMGVMSIDRLLITMSLPMMISMLVQALYNIVDSIFVSRIDEHALRAVSLAFPIQSLMIAVAVGTAVGINAFLSKTLGQKPDGYPAGAGIRRHLSDHLLLRRLRHISADLF